MKRQNNQMLFYTRDSGGKHETTPIQYVKWAISKAESLSLRFDGCPEDIQELTATGSCEKNDIYLDFDVCGNTISRPGLDAMFARLERDESVSHVAIPRRDRLARLDSAIDALGLEEKFHRLGVTIVYTDKELSPTPVGERRNIADLIVSLIEHDEAGRFRRVHADKMLRAQLTLAQNGYSTGGRAPYGFRRFLVSNHGITIRQLEDHETVKMPGHHVVWLPGPQEEMLVIRKIIDLLKTRPASQVAKILNQQGIPSPNAGRYRTDHGRRHQVMPIWRQTAVTNIARNPLLIALTRYGLRSMGDQARFSKTGPRSLTDTDLNSTSRTEKPKVKVIRNSVEDQIMVPAKFDPLIAPQEHQQIQDLLDRRAGTQRGKPRCVDPLNNPLGCRIFDVTCGWPMYRQPYAGSYQYLCGLYQQSTGHCCEHNRVPGPQAARLAMSCLQQELTNPKNLDRIRQIIRRQFRTTSTKNDEAPRVTDLQRQIGKLDAELNVVAANLARATGEKQFNAISSEFEKLDAAREKLQATLRELESTPKEVEVDEEAMVEKVLEKLERLTELVDQPDCREAVLDAIKIADLKMFLRFTKVDQGKRKINRLAYGIITLGSEPPPIEVYTGATNRKSISRTIAGKSGEKESGMAPRGHSKSCFSSCEDDLLGNVSRGDRI